MPPGNSANEAATATKTHTFSLRGTLKNSSFAAATTVDEAQSIYGRIFEFLDSFNRNPKSEGFASHMRNALEALKEVISTVINSILNITFAA
ncbi:hypothetical protein GcC1_009033 [Golovinomyces cichoracearum]|uniref:Uncharacterized protein n=1 Tax=Golovinomyces cichoracearum TaxID=62708 RepID=A0A420J830_9PEZI|nr:hypothetical protein GcC1_009033 [Golovinomyces cichoracearum]